MAEFRRFPSKSTILSVYAEAGDRSIDDLAAEHNLALPQVAEIINRRSYKKITYPLWRQLSPEEREYRSKHPFRRRGRSGVKLTEAQVRAIFSADASFSVEQLAAKYGVDCCTIWDIHSGRTWAWVTEEIRVRGVTPREVIQIWANTATTTDRLAAKYGLTNADISMIRHMRLGRKYTYPLWRSMPVDERIKLADGRKLTSSKNPVTAGRNGEDL